MQLEPDWFAAWFDRLFPPPGEVGASQTWTFAQIERALGVSDRLLRDAVQEGRLAAEKRPHGIPGAFEDFHYVVDRDVLRAWCLAAIEINREDYA